MLDTHKSLAAWEIKHNGQQSFSLAFESTIDMLNHKKLLRMKKGLNHSTMSTKSRNTEDIRKQLGDTSANNSPKTSNLTMNKKALSLSTRVSAAQIKESVPMMKSTSLVAKPSKLAQLIKETSQKKNLLNRFLTNPTSIDYREGSAKPLKQKKSHSITSIETAKIQLSDKRKPHMQSIDLSVKNE